METGLAVKQNLFLTVVENNVIGTLPDTFREYVEAKFKPQIITIQPVSFATKVAGLVVRTLIEAGVKDAKDNSVVTFLRETLIKDLKSPKFYKLTFEEIELAFHKGVRREYGEFMGVNIQTMHFWIKSYLGSKERELAVKEFYRKVEEVEFGSAKKDSKPNIEGQKKVIEILKPLAQNVQPSYVKKAKPPVQKTERDIFIQECFTEFGKILRKKAIKDHNGNDSRYAMIDGAPMDECDYAQMKLKEYDSLRINNGGTNQ